MPSQYAIYAYSQTLYAYSLISKFQNLKSQNLVLKYFMTSLLGVADEQRRQSPRLLIYQAGLEAAVDEPEALGHPSPASDPPRKGSNPQNILLK